jgi:cell division protein FtsW
MFVAEYAVDRPGRVDFGLVTAVILLWGLGMVTLQVTSANSGMRMFADQLYFIKRQLVYSAAGVAFMTVIALLDISVVKRLLPVVVIASLALCLLVFFPALGEDRNGARRWIRMPFGTTLQPSEFAKFAIVLFLANYFSKERSEYESPRTSIPVVGPAIFAFVIIMQKDFSTAAFIFSMCVLFFFVAGASVPKTAAIVILTAFVLLIFVFIEPYRVYRLIAFLNPEFDIHGINFQPYASRSAISSGGIFGRGIGSALSRIARIPEVQADYVFAGWAEAMGFVGVLAYIALLSFFAARGFFIAVRCPDHFGSLCAFGCCVCIVLQSLVNCGVAAGALPPTGIPLPFFSSGGSSLLSTFCMCGIILQVSRIKAGYKNSEKSGEVLASEPENDYA